MPVILALLRDPKPTVVRQSLSALQEVVRFRPELPECILQEIERMDLSAYRDNMTPLIQKDIETLLRVCGGNGEKDG